MGGSSSPELTCSCNLPDAAWGQMQAAPLMVGTGFHTHQIEEVIVNSTGLQEWSSMLQAIACKEAACVCWAIRVSCPLELSPLELIQFFLNLTSLQIRIAVEAWATKRQNFA